MAEDQPGFLSRWSRRKTDVLHGKPLDEPVAVPASKLPVAASPASLAPASAAAEAKAESASQTPAPEKLLSLDDVNLLTQESDFRPFMARNVGPDVRNAAMKKLFTDPHYNVMDGLDIYIDDYSIADPIPESMLRQMVGSKLLNIFNDQDEKDDQGLASPLAAADKEEALALSPSPSLVGDTVDEDANRTPSVFPPGEISTPAILPVPGAVDARALLMPQTAEQQQNPVAGTAAADAGADTKYNPGI